MKSSQPAALIIDDEVQIRRLLRLALESKGYRVFDAENGQLGLNETALLKPDVVLLDLGLPDMDGTEVLRRLREWSQVPVVVLSVRDSADDKISALDAGADDYVQKPFDTRELIARLRAVQRRAHKEGEASRQQTGDLMVDLAAHSVTVSDNIVKLTPIEFAMLRTLSQHSEKVVTQKHLLREVWGPQAVAQGQYLRVHMTHLRRKLADAGMQRAAIKTETGIGFRLVEL
jgi:two-component system, OmpR family, KDP operon response regulator KdpE